LKILRGTSRSTAGRHDLFGTAQAVAPAGLAAYIFASLPLIVDE
jgi:hypothetical protein